ncbi:phage tail protein, partial [Aeromonas salmonicida]|uniref:phage tail protein n=1 Tax=Aeromonas salmonicida TaxID=645 RepID=UPI0037EFD67D
MSAIYFAIPTDAGQAKIANALALGIPLKITHMAVGDGNGQPVTPNAAQTALIRENRRAPLNTLFQDPLNQAQLVAEQIIPEDVGNWWIREVGLFSEDGTLIAVANCPDTYKPLLSSGAGRTQVIRLVLIVSDTSAVELKIDPSVVLATRKYVDDVMAAHKQSRDHPEGSQTEKGFLRLATQAEAVAGLLDSVAVAPKEMKVAMESLLDIVAPIGVPIPWVAATPPNSRFLIAQGQSFNKVAYPKLGALWPTGVIPFDMRGEF